MRTRVWMGVGLLMVALPSCDDVNVGQPPADTGAPEILRILIQDSSTYQVIDLLNTAPALACADDNPCEAGTQGLVPTCVINAGSTQGTCVDPTAQSNPFSVGSPGTIQVRVVLSKLLDGAAVEDTEIPDGGTVDDRQYAIKTPSAFQLLGPDGTELPYTDKYWDPSGSAYDTADPIVEPLGPALVINVAGALEVSSKYTVKVDGSTLQDSLGQSITQTSLGALDPAGYHFTTQGLFVEMATPDVTTAMPPAIAPNDVLSFATNADVAAASALATVKNSGGAVTVLAWLEEGGSPSQCSPQPRTIDVFPIDSNQLPTSWSAGAYTLSLTAKDADTGKTTLAPFSGAFTVAGAASDPATDPAAVVNHALPAQCTNLPAMDLGAPNPDGGAFDAAVD